MKKVAARSKTDLEAAFKDLPRPPGDIPRALSASVVGEGKTFRIGRDQDENPTLLIEVPPSPSDSPPLPSIRLAKLRVQHRLQCNVVENIEGIGRKSQKTLVLSAVTCLDRELDTYFLRVCAAILEYLGERPSSSDISSVISRLADLFQALARPARTSIQGLWAELYLIAHSRNPAVLLDAWHITPGDRFDFAHATERVEVKSYAGALRRHHFSLEQLRPSEDLEVVVASMQVVPSSAGKSVQELVDEVQADAPSSEQVLKIEEIVAASLGSAIREASDIRFDTASAMSTLQLYEAETIPSVNSDLPRGVSDVRFAADLGGVEPAVALAGTTLFSALESYWRG